MIYIDHSLGFMESFKESRYSMILVKVSSGRTGYSQFRSKLHISLNLFCTSSMLIDLGLNKDPFVKYYFYFGALPTQFGAVSTSNLKYRTILFTTLMAKVTYNRCNQKRVQVVKHILGHDCLKHSRCCKRSNRIDKDIAFNTFSG